MYKIYNEDVLSGLAKIKSESIQCCITLNRPVIQFFAFEVKRIAHCNIFIREGEIWYCKYLPRQETNIGAITGRAVNAKSFSKNLIEQGAIGNAWVKPPRGLKPKDLCMIPARVAIALQHSGWWLRQDIIWSKPNPMPESVRDRCTKSHEYIFLLTKSARYYYDADAIKEKSIDPDDNRGDRGNRKRFPTEKISGIRGPGIYPLANKRSVWNITTQPYSGAHFATFPEEIPTICINAGSKKGDTILDPFAGSGTAGDVALRMERDFIGIELNEKDVKNLINPRLENVNPLFKKVITL